MRTVFRTNGNVKSCTRYLVPMYRHSRETVSTRTGTGPFVRQALVIDQPTSYTELEPQPVAESVPGCVVVVR
jgi:hypothetical protein